MHYIDLKLYRCIHEYARMELAIEKMLRYWSSHNQYDYLV